MNDRRPQYAACYELKCGERNKVRCPTNRKHDSNKYSDEKVLERLQKESEIELEKARKMLKKTETVVKQSRKVCADTFHKRVKKRPSKTCKLNHVTESRDAIRRLTKVTSGKECECPDGKSRASGKGIPSLQKSGMPSPEKSAEETKELPKKPKLTAEQINELLNQEARDVENALFLTSEIKDLYKKPCPKQQKARDAVRALLEPKTEEPLPCQVSMPKELPPFIDPDPDDISPEIAANMMYTQERGIKMISCPEETVRHLFAAQLKDDEKDTEQRKGEEESDEIPESDIDETEEADDSVFTRNMSQRETIKNYDTLGSRHSEKTEFVLQGKESKCVNMVQLRGNCAPWFPGYFTAFPEDVGDPNIQLGKSPSLVFKKAWTAAKPSSVPPADLYLVE